MAFDRGFVGAQSSGVNLGSLRLQGRHLEQLPLSLRAQSLWEEIEALVGETVEFDQNGHLYFATEDDQIEKLRRMAEAEAAYAHHVELLGANDVHRRWPFLASHVIGGSWSPRSATVNPRLVCPAVARAAKRLGADVREGVEVTGVERVGNRFELSTAQGITIESDHLINSAGAWALDIAAKFGETAPMFPAGPAQMATEPVPHFVDPVIHAADSSIIFRQTSRGNILIAGHPRVPVDAEQRRSRVPPHKIIVNMHRLLAVVDRAGPAASSECGPASRVTCPTCCPYSGPASRRPI